MKKKNQTLSLSFLNSIKDSSGQTAFNNFDSKKKYLLKRKNKCHVFQEKNLLNVRRLAGLFCYPEINHCIVNGSSCAQREKIRLTKHVVQVPIFLITSAHQNHIIKSSNLGFHFLSQPLSLCLSFSVSISLSFLLLLLRLKVLKVPRDHLKI